MKKLPILLGILCSTFLNAQTSKGSMLLGTNFVSGGFTSSKFTDEYSNTSTVYNSDGNSFSMSLNPSVGFFVVDGLAIGGQVYLSYYNSKSNSSNSGSNTTSESKYSQPSLGVGPYARYYFMKGKMSPFVQVEANYDFNPSKSSSSTSTGASSETNTSGATSWNTGSKFGFEYFISEYVGLNASVGLSYGSSKTTYEYRPSTGSGYDYTSTYNRFYVPISFGIQVHLPSKK